MVSVFSARLQFQHPTRSSVACFAWVWTIEVLRRDDMETQTRPRKNMDLSTLPVSVHPNPTITRVHTIRMRDSPGVSIPQPVGSDARAGTKLVQLVRVVTRKTSDSQGGRSDEYFKSNSKPKLIYPSHNSIFKISTPRVPGMMSAWLKLNLNLGITGIKWQSIYCSAKILARNHARVEKLFTGFFNENCTWSNISGIYRTSAELRGLNNWTTSDLCSGDEFPFLNLCFLCLQAFQFRFECTCIFHEALLTMNLQWTLRLPYSISFFERPMICARFGICILEKISE